MYSHGCCILTVCVDGTFQRKNVISVSIDVMRLNTDTKISKLKHQHPDGAHCTLQTSSLHRRSLSGAGGAKPPMSPDGSKNLPQ